MIAWPMEETPTSGGGRETWPVSVLSSDNGIEGRDLTIAERCPLLQDLRKVLHGEYLQT